MHLFYIEETDPLDRHRAEIIKLCMRAEVLEQRAAALPPGSERDAVVDSQIENIKKALLILEQYPETPTLTNPE